MRSLARACIRHRRITVVSWIVLLLVCIAAAASLGEEFSTNFELPESDSQQAFELLQDRFPEQSGDSFQVVFQTTDGKLTDPANQAVLEETADAFDATDVVTGVSLPTAQGGVISEDGTIGLATAQIDGRSFDVETDDVDELIEIGEQAGSDAVQVELGGDLIRYGQQQESSAAEGVGVLAAIIVLLITFGSVVAMGLPILTALIALGTALSLVTVFTHVIDTADFAPALAAMIGLGVGIDYALFLVTRFRTNLKAGFEVEQAVEIAMDTAGRAVLFAGATVCVALLGLFAIGVDFLYGPALAASLAVLVTMFAALTLLPAMLSKVGHNIDRWRLPGMRGEQRVEGKNWSRWSKAIQRRPWTAALSSALVLIVLAIPIFSIELGNADAGTDAKDTTTRKAYDLLAEGFGPGFNGPLLVVTDLSGSTGDDEATLEQLDTAIADTPGVADVQPPNVSPSGDTAVSTLFPTTGPQEVETRELVDRLRDETIAPLNAESGLTTYLGGETAINVDFDSYISSKLPLFVGIVVLLSALLLLIAFRSILVPLKAVLMNVLSIGASFGIVVAIFQFGWGNELIGLSETAPIASFLPVFVFAIVFGLSMDYEVFLISRVHEEWERRGDASSAVQHGLASTGRVITAAALIMICVFSSFALGGDLTIKLFGVSLAMAIFIDAFVIRSILVPAIMELMGERAWWLPDWLDRLLPKVKLESEEAPRMIDPDEESLAKEPAGV